MLAMRCMLQGPLVIENLRLLSSFTGHPQEAYFHLTTLEIEAKGGAIIPTLERVLHPFVLFQANNLNAN